MSLFLRGETVVYFVCQWCPCVRVHIRLLQPETKVQSKKRKAPFKRERLRKSQKAMQIRINGTVPKKEMSLETVEVLFSFGLNPSWIVLSPCVLPSQTPPGGWRHKLEKN